MRNLKRKIFEITALTVFTLFMSSTVFAQIQESQRDTSVQDTSIQAEPQEQNQRMNDDLRSQDPDEGVNYSETVEESELPQEITSSLDELYPAHDVEEIQRGDDESYKVKVKNQDDEAFVYYDSEGKFLRARNLSDVQGAFPQQQGQRTRDSEYGTDDRNRMGTGTDTRTNQGTQQGQWGTEDRSNQQGTGQGRTGTGTDTRTNQGTQQGQWGTDDRSDKKDSTGTQGSQWGTQKNKNEGSAYPQDQNQRTRDSQYGTHEGTMEKDHSEQGALEDDDDHTGTHGTTRGRTGTDSQYGTSSSQPGSSGQSGTSVDRSSSEYGTTRSDDKSMGQDRGTTFPQEQSQQASEDVEYSEEVKENDLPDSVSESLDELYPDHDIDKAYRGEDGSYKVKLKKDNDEVTVYYDSNGLFHREEKFGVK